MQRATQGLARLSLADPSNQVATRGKSFTLPFLRQLDLSWTQACPLLFPSVAPRPSPHLAGRQSSDVRYYVPVHAPAVASQAAAMLYNTVHTSREQQQSSQGQLSWRVAIQ